MKRNLRHLILTALLAVLGAASAWAQPEAIQPSGNGNQDNPFVFTTVNHMKWLMDTYSTYKKIDDGPYMYNAYYELGADIDLSSIENWNPIKTDSGFTGNFDGKGHTLSNLTCENQYAGFFYSIATCTIKDINFANVNITGTKNAGALAAMGYNGKANISGVNVLGGTVTCTGGNAGGLVSTNAGNFTKCINMADVTANGVYAGGIVGTASSVVIEGCFNTGKVTNTNTAIDAQAGGLAGRGSSSTFRNCRNSGIVKGSSRAGGIVGTSNNTTITNCLSEGKITCDVYAGRITGRVENTVNIINCGWDESVEIVRAADKQDEIGGQLYSSCVLTTTNVQAFTEADFSSGKATYLLQGDQDILWWSQRLPQESYPVLNRGGDAYRVNFDGTIYCGGYEYAGHYTNDNVTTNRQDHQYVSGICSYCHDISQPEIVDGFYQIANAGHLLWFSRFTRQGSNYTASAKVIDDIDLSGFCHPADPENGIEAVNWEPIGDPSNHYGGTFDGQGHTISGLYLGGNRTDKSGLFLGLRNYTTVSNLKLANVNINLPDCTGVGALAGYIFGTNCRVSHVSVLSGNISGKEYVGGIAGMTWQSAAVVEYCDNSAQVTANQNGGGILGYSYYSITLDHCTNHGAVGGSGDYYAGIVGNGTTQKITVTDCLNDGAITGRDYTGGIMGMAASATITRCNNNAIILGRNYVGGIVGRLQGDNSVISFCSNLCDWDYTGRNASYIAGIAGYVTSGTIEDCLNRGEIYAPNATYVGGIVGRATAGTVKVSYCLNEGSIAAQYGNPSDCGLIYGGGTAITITGCYASDACAINIVKNSTELIPVEGTNRFYRAANPVPLTGTIIAEGASQEDYTSGATAYALQGGRDGVHWGQNLDSETAPILGSSFRVYLNGLISCGGEVAEGGTYSNTEGVPVQQSHSYDKFDFCVNCHHPHEPEEVDGVRQIGSVGQLVWFQQEVNYGHPETNAMLTTSIDLGDYCQQKLGEAGWEPIGTMGYKYSGTFDGHGNQIYNFTINRPNANAVGLFGYVDGGNIRNLWAQGTVNGNIDVGLICGQFINNSSNPISIEKCVAMGEVHGQSCVGGVVGRASSKTSVLGCINQCTVYGWMSFGGVAGEADNIVSDCINAGYVYWVENENTNAYGGGIVGFTNGYAAQVTRSSNYGKINCGGGSNIGGIVGYSASNTSTSFVSYCINVADIITGRSSVGGIVGRSAHGNIDHCFSQSEITSEFASCGAVIGAFESYVDLNSLATDLLYYDASQNMNVAGSPQPMTDKYADGLTAQEVLDGCAAARIGLPFGQKIGEDENPEIDGPQVWYGSYIHADEERAYDTPCGSNTEHLSEAYDPHHIVRGICTVCGRHNGENYLLDVTHTFEDWTSENKGQSSTTASHTWSINGVIDAPISFDWTVSSERNFDFLTITMTAPDGTEEVLVDSESGDNMSGQETYVITQEGTYTLKAEYKKDGSGDWYDDEATLTNVMGPSLVYLGLNCDLNDDTNIDMTDVNILKTVLGRYIKPDDSKYDFNGDGRVTIADLTILIKHLLP